MINQNKIKFAIKKEKPFRSDSLFLEIKNKFLDVFHEIVSFRELQCLSLWLMGYTMENVGHFLYISPRTVESHLANIRDKIQLKKRIDITKKLLHHRIYDTVITVAKQIINQVRL